MSCPTGDTTTVVEPKDQGHVNSIRKSLQQMPTELLLLIAQSLPPSGLMSLTYTCQRIKRNLNVSIRDILGPSQSVKDSTFEEIRRKLEELRRGMSLPNLTGRTGLKGNAANCDSHSDPKRLERLELVYMLDRDGQIAPSKAVCSTCAAVHEVSLFSVDSLRLDPRNRQCVGSAGRIWICPHWHISHEEAHTMVRDSHVCGSQKVFVGQLGLNDATIILPVTHLVGGEVPSRRKVKKVLQPLDIYVCPHLRVKDKFILRHYSPDCSRLKSDSMFVGSPQHCTDLCKCKACLWGLCTCAACGTVICFSINTLIGGRSTLYITPRREIPNCNITDPKWISQVASPPEIAAFDRACAAGSGHS